MVFWRNNLMILHHFCWRSSKKHVIFIKNPNIWPKFQKIPNKIPILYPKHVKFDQKSWFGHVRTCPDLSRRTSTYFKPAEILFFRFYTFPFFINNFIIFYKIIFSERIYHFYKKSSVLLKSFMSFCKIIGFTKRIGPHQRIACYRAQKT